MTISVIKGMMNINSPSVLPKSLISTNTLLSSHIHSIQNHFNHHQLLLSQHKHNKMLLTSPPILQFKFLSLSTPFLHGATTPAARFPKPSTSTASEPPSAAALPVIKAMRSLQGKVVCATNDKTVAVEVVRLAPHPKYKRRVRKKKTYQAHDPLNQFQVGDLVQLEKGRPISKTKTFWAAPVAPRARNKANDEAARPQELGIPLESQS